MAREFAKDFYASKAWRECRKRYRQSVGGLCERCLSKGIYKAGEIVHHKIHVEPDTIDDPDILLSWDNLELVCRDCHGELHQIRKKRYTVDEAGRVSPLLD